MIYEKLLKVQSELKAPKSQFNSFGKYNYRNCDDILEAVKPLLNEHGLCLIISDSIEMLGDRFYIKSSGELHDIKDGDKVVVSALARESSEKKGMDSAQITGSASSYARKYMLNGLFAIDDSKDPDSQKPAPPAPTISEFEAVKTALKKVKSLADLENYYKVHIKPRFSGVQLKELEEACKDQKATIQLSDVVK